eukprot:g1270.t1
MEDIDADGAGAPSACSLKRQKLPDSHHEASLATKVRRASGQIALNKAATTSTTTTTTVSVFGRISKSVVKIYNTAAAYDYENPWSAPKQHQGFGSGFFIEKNRIVTNAHVVSNTTFIQVRKAGTSKKFPAKLKRILHSVDLAILELDADAILSGGGAAGSGGVGGGGKRSGGTKNQSQTAEAVEKAAVAALKERMKQKVIADFFKGTVTLKLGETPRVGDEVFAYGFPWGGEEMSLTKGVVSRVEMNEAAHGGGSEVLSCDMDTAIVGGNSGGPVIGKNLNPEDPLDEDRVVGVVFQGYDAKPGGYMIAVDVLKRVVALDDEGAELKTPGIGLTVQKLENKSLRRALGLDVLENEEASSGTGAGGGGGGETGGSGAGAGDEEVAEDQENDVEKNNAAGRGPTPGQEAKAASGSKIVTIEKTESDGTKLNGYVGGMNLRKIKTEVLVEERESTKHKLGGGIMVCRVGEFSPLYEILQPRDVLLQIGDFPVGENGTIELRKGERTKWTHGCFTGKTLGEKVFLKWFRDGFIHSATVALRHKPADIRYAVEHLYDVRPKFVLRGGIVFQPFTRNLCLKGAYARSRIKALMPEYRTAENPDYVLVTKILQADLTAGYDRIRNLIVERINGITIHTLEDVVKAFESVTNDVAGVVGTNDLPGFGGSEGCRGREATDVKGALQEPGEVGAHDFVEAGSSWRRAAKMSETMLTCDMEEGSEMRQDAISQGSLAVQKFETEKDIAKHIKNFFDAKYAPGWHCIVGKSFNCAATFEAKTYAFFQIGPMMILVFKS